MPSSVRMNEARYLVELENQVSVSRLVPLNVAWSSTSVAKEKNLLPIRIPISKGILGYRIALIAKDKQAKFDQVKTLADIRDFTIGQGLGWGDIKVYEANGFNVRSTQY